MELLICLWLASLVMGGRVATDIIHGLKGTTPPHVAKAQIKAQQQAAAASKAKGGRSPYAAGKPRLKDVAAVYWGDAMADAIDLHNTRRAKKKAGGGQAEPVAEKGPSLWKQIGQLLVRPVGEPKPEPEAEQPTTQPRQTVPTWQCRGCGLDFTGREPVLSRCVPCTRATAPKVPMPAVVAIGASTRVGLYDLGPDNCLICHQPGEVVQQAKGRTFVHDATGGRCPGIEPRPGDPKTVAIDPGGTWGCGQCGASSDGVFRDQGTAMTHFVRTHLPVCPGEPEPSNEGEDMTDTTSSTGTATGDAHNVETAIHECNALADDLTAIDTALDVIDERITSAGGAAEGIEVFLTLKNVDDAAVGGMSVARDMLSPTHIKALIDAVAAAKQGVQNALAELTRLQELESQLNGADGSVLNGR